MKDLAGDTVNAPLNMDMSRMDPGKRPGGRVDGQTLVDDNRQNHSTVLPHGFGEEWVLGDDSAMTISKPTASAACIFFRAAA